MSEVEPPPPGTEDAELLMALVPHPVETVPSRADTAATSASAASLEVAIEHEEGEIEDDDEDDQRPIEYENISSDEEFIIRERLLQLEAMDSELGRQKNRNAGRSGNGGQSAAARHNAYVKRSLQHPIPPPPPIISGKENYECISDDDDDVGFADLFRYDPVPKPKPLPVRRKPRTGSESLRSSSSIRRPSGSSTVRGHYVSRGGDLGRRPSRGVEKRRHEARKHSLERKRKRRKEMASTTPVNVVDSSDSERDFPLDRARLQAACSISSKQRKTDKENWDALKRKLQMQMRKKSQEVVEIVGEEPMLVDDGEDDEDDEEVLQLRLQALKTKAELKETDVISLLEEHPIEPMPASEKAAEEQELRMIALQSAFTKKHQIRLKKRQEERPYSPSDEIRLLSPVTDLPEVVDVDDEVVIIETKPETVEIADSSDEENRMEISPSESPNTVEAPNVQPVDMELATSGESQSPAPVEVVSKEPEVVVQLDSPVSPVNEETGDLQSKFPEEDDEETLRNQLLSNLSGSMQVARPLTPDSMGEEEVDALRELILSRMNNKKVSKQKEQVQTPPQASEISNELNSQNIPPVGDEPPSIASDQPSSKVSTVNQSRGPTNPNLITLIGKQKIARKKKKKSAAKAARQAAAAAAAAAVVGPVAIAAPPPSRSLVKVPIPQVPTPPVVPPVIQAPAVMTTKVLVNPNKLINLNTINRSAKEQSQKSAMVESYVQKPVPKLVIQLGQSDSDSDPDYYSAPQSEPEVEVMRETFLRDLDNASPSRVTLESPTYSPIPAVEPDEQPASVQKPPDPAFAQRLDQFLRTVRSQTDQNQNVTELPPKPATTGSGSNGSGTRSIPAPSPRKPVTAPTTATPITPLAVRHLPKSAQLEYKRLLARMAQLEKQRQQRFVIQNTSTNASAPPALTKTIVNNDPEDADASKNHEIVVTLNQSGRDVIDKSSPSPKQDTLIKRVLINNTVTAGGAKLVPQATVAPVQVPAPQETKDNETSKTAVKDASQKSPTKVAGRKETAVPEDPDLATLREALRRLPRIKEDDRHRVLKLAEARYENHSKRFREELQELIGTVENAQYERQKQYDLENKVAFLREKLTVLERALVVHKQRCTTIFPTLQESHTRVMASRKKSIELNNLCQAIGREVLGPSYSPPSGLRGEIHQRLKVLTSETKELKNMKKLTLEEFKKCLMEQRRRQHPEPVQEEPRLDPQPEPSTVDQEERTVEQVPVESQQAPPEKAEIVIREPEPAPIEMVEAKPCAKSAPASRSASPLAALEPARPTVTQEAPAVLSSEPTWSRFEKYSSPLTSLRSAQNIPDGVICPYQMRGECVDKDCKFEHLS